ncbi:hypothetical protein GA0061098_101692 [Bradyrhizobium shewense]|uniref:Uncharacterized protein n=1 Tax=Bradyrhizobium shewense TaxID=1761772 RepID=A0A1C3XHX1_9BRAD|nr:hypothetical protein GA0061098_101692 [Bradyrhizobium shewense]
MGMARNLARALCEPPRKSEATMEASCAMTVVQWPLVRQDPQIREATRGFPPASRAPFVPALPASGLLKAAALVDPAGVGAVEPTSGCSFSRDPQHHQRH